MSLNARKKLDEFDAKDASAWDAAVVLLDYLHHTSETSHEQQVAVHAFLARWRKDIEQHAAPIQLAKAERVGRTVKELLNSALAEIDDLKDASGVSRADVKEGRGD